MGQEGDRAGRGVGLKAVGLRIPESAAHVRCSSFQGAPSPRPGLLCKSLAPHLASAEGAVRGGLKPGPPWLTKPGPHLCEPRPLGLAAEDPLRAPAQRCLGDAPFSARRVPAATSVHHQMAAAA